MLIDFEALPGSQLLSCTDRIGFRDPAAIVRNGRLYCYYTFVEESRVGGYTFRLGLSVTEDLVHWEDPVMLTEADRKLNWSSPGCILPMPDGMLSAGRKERAWYRKISDVFP